jgi:DNA-binding FadR family transcriptional regulator
MTTAAETTSGELLRSLVERTVFTPVRHGSAVADTVARLGRAIGMGLLRPGDRLPREAELAEDLGISPVTLRSALTILRGAGVLATQRGRGGGTVVADAAFPLSLLDDAALPTERELADLADFRCVVEGGAAALAAERATPEQVAHLQALVAELEDTPTFDPWGERDTLLHLAIADASGSERLVGQVAEIRGDVYRIATLGSIPRSSLDLADEEHREIVRAIAAGRPGEAREAMVRHVQSTRALWLGLGRAAVERRRRS